MHAGNARERTAALSQSEVAELFGLTKRRVQQIETMALAKIRRAIKRDAAEWGLSVEEWLEAWTVKGM